MYARHYHIPVQVFSTVNDLSVIEQSVAYPVAMVSLQHSRSINGLYLHCRVILIHIKDVWKAEDIVLSLFVGHEVVRKGE